MSAGGSVEGNSSNSGNKCASCRHQRRRCPNDCIFRPYFPLEKRNDFEAARRIFGISNMERMLRDLKVQDRAKAVKSMIWEASCWSRDSIKGPLGCLKRVINSESQGEKENQKLLKRVYDMVLSGRTLLEEKQQNQTYEQWLMTTGSVNDKVHPIPNSDFATSHYVDSEKGLELHSKGNSYTRRGSVNPQEIAGGRFLRTLLPSSPLPNHEMNATRVREIGLSGCIGQDMPSNQHPIVEAELPRNLEGSQAVSPLCSNNPQEKEGGRILPSVLQPGPSPNYEINGTKERETGHLGHVVQAPATSNPILQVQRRRNLDYGQVDTPLRSNNPEAIEGGTLIQLSKNEIHERDIGHHGHVAQASSSSNPIVQEQQKRNLEGHQAASPSLTINPQGIDYGRIRMSWSQVNPWPYQYGNDIHVEDIGLNDHIVQVPSVHIPTVQEHQRRNQHDETSSRAAFFNTYHQVSLPPTYNHQGRDFHVHGQAVINPNIVHAQQMLGHGVDFHGSANVAPEPSRVGGTEVLQAPYHVDYHDNPRRRSGCLEDVVNLQYLQSPGPNPSQST